MTTTKTTTLRGYEFCTPKFAGDRQFEKVYDCELLDLLFKSILRLDKSIRKYANDTVSINLGGFQQSNDANIVEGHFITARHGVRRSQIDIPTQEEVGTIEVFHGVENNVYFMIDRRTGLLLVQEDFNKVFTRKLLQTFIHSHKNIIYPYIEEFNKLNSEAPLTIHKRSCYRLTTLPPINFMEQLREFSKVKSAILTLDSTTEKRGVDVSQILDQELEDNEICDYDLEIKIKNKTGSSLVRVFQRYFEAIIEQQKYDSYAIEGELENGKSKKITPDTITRDYYGEIRYNSNGEASSEDIFSRMTRIITYENPLQKNGTPNITPVGENRDVNMAIQEEISKRNQNSIGQQETS